VATTSATVESGKLAKLLPGLGVALVLGFVAQGLALVQQAALGRIWLEALVIALLLGVLVRNLGIGLGPVEPGAAYAGKQVLEVAVVLLGVSVDAAALAATGPRLALAIVLGVTTVLLLGSSSGGCSGSALGSPSWSQQATPSVAIPPSPPSHRSSELTATRSPRRSR